MSFKAWLLTTTAFATRGQPARIAVPLPAPAPSPQAQKDAA